MRTRRARKKARESVELEGGLHVGMMKAGVELASDVTDQVKKGWSAVKKHGIPLLSKFGRRERGR